MTDTTQKPEQCWASGCYNPAKYAETTVEYERPDGTPAPPRLHQSMVTRPRGYCGIHAPSRAAARKKAQKSGKASREYEERLAGLRVAAARTSLRTVGAWLGNGIIDEGIVARYGVAYYGSQPTATVTIIAGGGTDAAAPFARIDGEFATGYYVTDPVECERLARHARALGNAFRAAGATLAARAELAAMEAAEGGGASVTAEFEGGAEAVP